MVSLYDAHSTITEREPSLYGAHYGCDLRLFTRYSGIPAVVYSPGGIRLAHAIEQLETATKALALLVCQMV